MARDFHLDTTARPLSARTPTAEPGRPVAAPALSTAPANPLVALALLLGRQTAREHLQAISERGQSAPVEVSSSPGAIGPGDFRGRKKAPT
jgi:hypothetical protein